MAGPSNEDAQIAELTDAVARGRLALAEVAQISADELEAIYELGAQRLDADRIVEAETIFAGLIALFPFSACYWRAYGIALHRTMHLQRARDAYDTALLLDAETADIRCYRGEVLLYLGELRRAAEDLEAVVRCGDPLIERRAKNLLQAIVKLDGWQPPAKPTAVENQPEEEGFSMADGRPLPLEEGRFAALAELDDELTEEITQTAARFMPRQGELADETAPPKEPTITAIVARRPKAAAKGDDGQAAAREPTTTAVIPGRREKLAATAVKPAAGRGLASREVTQTAVVRRRLGLTMAESEEEE